MEDFIEIDLNYITILISFTLNFAVINFINMTYFYKGILPYLSEKIKNITKTNLNVSLSDIYKFDKNYKETVKKSNKKYYTESIKFYLLLLMILLFINLLIYINYPKDYKTNFNNYFVFTNLRNSVLLILFSLLVQFIYYTGFAFKYYLYIIYKYIFEFLKVN